MMPMVCLWPDCQGTYCKVKCPHQEEIVRANAAEGLVEVGGMLISKSLRDRMDRDFDTMFGPLPANDHRPASGVMVE